ncbi:MAG TPA: hypothetical protein VGU67_02105 [Edaphobacter sp.]|nr:hypothetical protein [Edaphobacter sp.]
MHHHLRLYEARLRPSQFSTLVLSVIGAYSDTSFVSPMPDIIEPRLCLGRCTGSGSASHKPLGRGRARRPIDLFSLKMDDRVLGMSERTSESQGQHGESGAKTVHEAPLVYG